MDVLFSQRIRDLGDNYGFQWDFFCDVCGAARRSPREPWAAPTRTRLLDGLTAIALDTVLLAHPDSDPDSFISAARKDARDEAFERAVEAVRLDFVRCPSCLHWVCRERCWRPKADSCAHCAASDAP